ncbi:MAG: hypothetical protein ABF384_15620 [Verrucomicrobiales bacterium]
MRNPFSMEQAPADGQSENLELSSVFNWTKNQKKWRYLIGFLFFSLIIHVAGFYLFKVVYPPPVRMDAKGESVTLMDSGDPGVRALMQRIEDRTVFLFPPSRRAGVRLEAEDADVRFSPSYQDSDLQLKPPTYPWNLPPPIESGIDSNRLEAPAPRFSISQNGAISGREVAPWSILQNYIEQAESLPEISLNLTVAPDGSVEVIGIEGALEKSDREQFAAVVESTLRFLPSEAEAEGRITIRSTGIGNEFEKPGTPEQL